MHALVVVLHAHRVLQLLGITHVSGRVRVNFHLELLEKNLVAVKKLVNIVQMLEITHV